MNNELFPAAEPDPSVPELTAEERQLPALSIRQPWATLIVMGCKDVENRIWRTAFRGRFLIHAAKGCTKDEMSEGIAFATRVLAEKGEYLTVDPAKLERGGIIGVATLTHCVSGSSSPWFTGLWGFLLWDVQPRRFTPCRGELKFFHPVLP